jgi:predicted transcriptional regulator of viral defense system
MNQPPEQKLYLIAEKQLGYFTAKQAISAGYQPKNHAYHTRCGHWIREYRSIYRLAHFPHSAESEMVLWALWSRNRQDVPEGVYSHETALNLYDVGDAMPAKLHMTVPIKFRKSADIPPVLILHRAKLSAGDIQQNSGYAVTTPFHTILDLKAASTPKNIIDQAIREFRSRGLLTERDMASFAERNA